MRQAAEITISATPETVWSVLADTDNYPSFDPGIARIIGGPLTPERFAPEVNRKGNEVRLRPVRLIVYSVEDGDTGRLFRVGEFGPPRYMVWTERATFGLVVRERTFLVERAGPAGARFRIAQETTGRLARFAERWEPKLDEAFQRFCAGLKGMAETLEAVKRERRAR
ncbi:MAG: SRPBCC family protein [Bauldia sp.]|nr:SRPBCC family protein [Bauldia sp.]